MTAARRSLLVALVLTNLAFVQITEAADWVWLGPLAGLTLASPLLLRLRRHLAYRLAWNLAVVLVFAQLVNHTTSAGVHNLLEDGLLLAALCQVHLLNNIGPDQKPDLLLFNSFLIAVVTSFLCIDVNYLLVFLLYAPILILTMQVLALKGIREGLGPVLRAGLPKAAVALGLTMLVFLFLPRDFHRRGLLGDRFRFRPPGSVGTVDFTEKVDLARSGSVRVSDRVVMRVHAEEGTAPAVPTYWRGATLDSFDGSEWRKSSRGDRCFHRPPGSPRRTVTTVRVQLEDPYATRLFAPLSGRLSRARISDDPLRVVPVADGTYIYPRSGGNSPRVTYHLDLTAGEPRARVPRDQAPFLDLPRHALPPEVAGMAENLAARLPDGAGQADLVERTREYLQNRYRYLLPGEEGSAGSLGEFLVGGAGGHCEYFATALAVLLRSGGVPCRLVTGYRSEEWDPEMTVLTIRARHAHAWVEALDPDRGWVTVDACPAGEWSDRDEGRGILARLKTWVAALWDRITGFDAEARDRALAWLASAPGRLVADVGHRPAPYGLVAACLVALLAVRALSRRRREPAAVADYRRVLRRTGLVRRADETPRETLDRAHGMALRPRRLERLSRATLQHETRRYAATERSEP